MFVVSRLSRIRLFPGLILICFSYLGLELISLVGYYVAFGTQFSASDLLLKAREVVSASDEPDLQQAIAGSISIPHPYLGFVYDPRSQIKHNGIGISNMGFIDDKEPIQKRQPNKILVGVFGGSVAWWFSEQAKGTFIEELRKNPYFREKEIVLIRVALGAWKQPQQLQALSYLLALGAEFDFIINIDGFNEVQLAEYGHSQSPYYPHTWSLMMKDGMDATLLRRIGRVESLKEWRVYWAKLFSRNPLSYSVTAGTVWALIDRQLVAKIEASRQQIKRVSAEGSYNPVTLGPKHHFKDRAHFYKTLAKLWYNSSRAMADLCKSRGIDYFHFLQPNQYVPNSKNFSEKERSQVFGVSALEGVSTGYPILRELGQRLADSGVHFYDTSMIFAEVRDVTYIDTCCHLSEKGNAILGRFIGSTIKEAYERERELSRASLATP